MNKDILKTALTENGVYVCLAKCESMLQIVKYAKELSLAIAVIFLTFLTMIYFAVTKIPNKKWPKATKFYFGLQGKHGGRKLSCWLCGICSCRH